MWAREAAGGLPRPFWVLWAGMFVNRAGCFVVPFMAVYLTQERRFPVAAAGMVAALYGAGAAIASPLGGYLADHAGRRVTMLGALLLGGTGMMALGFARRLEVIAPACFLVALLGEAYRPAMQAAVADLVPPHDRVRAIGLVYWVINLGFAFGLTLAGVLASHSFLYLFLGDGLTSIAFALIVWRGVPETRPAPQPHAPPARGLVGGFLAPYRDAPFVVFLVANLVAFLVFMQHTTAMPVDMTAHHVSRAALGVVMALNGIVIVVVQPVLTALVARFDRSRVLAAGVALMSLGFGLNAVATNAVAYGADVVVWTLGEICVLPVAGALVADVARPELRGRYQGAYGLCFGLAACGAPLIGAGVLQHAGGPVLWAGCFAAGLLAAAAQWMLGPRLRQLREERLSAAHAAGATP